MIDWEHIERGLERGLELLRRNRQVGEEFAGSRSEFFIGPVGVRTSGAERRHLEWFLLERPSAALGGVPAHIWRAELADGTPDLGAAFLQSLPGAFEVTSLIPGEGLWVRDLFTQGEHPVAENQASAALQVGDLLVGRLYPAGGGTFLLSPAVSLFRRSELLSAVRADLEQMRAARRGVLRIQQLELERLFHSPQQLAAHGTHLESERVGTRAALVELGLDATQAAQVLDRVHQAALARDGTAFTEILNQLAFDTGIDLTAARLVLTNLWHTEKARVPAVPESAENADTHAQRTALGAFDRGRAEGKDLELLFRELERSLGVADEGEEEGVPGEDAGAPDFPGVVSAMVEEFLWDSAREDGEQRALELRSLRLLGNYASEIGVFEELGSQRLLDFSARWLLDESGLREAQELTCVLDALAHFCKWCEERHEVALWTQFGETLIAVQRSLPRHARLRARLSKGQGKGVHRIVSLKNDAVRLKAKNGHETSLVVSSADLADLRDGDLVRLAGSKGDPVLGATYPAELAGLLS
ncbi:MAG: hypothetical protein EXS08_12305 [Planctomycetes bacterium]|nr:hypothetical protein [Planctomycetota bacterium]